jgi:hypothetical protein
MTSHSRFITILSLTIIIAGIAFYALTRPGQTPEQTRAATINRDCAPWDGSAFTVSIHVEDANISISIYQTPDIKYPTTFSFPDNTMSVGNALLILPIDPPQQLNGRVSFQGVQQDSPVEGLFDLTTATGEKFKGRFIAKWGNEIVFCG